MDFDGTNATNTLVVKTKGQAEMPLQQPNSLLLIIIGIMANLDISFEMAKASYFLLVGAKRQAEKMPRQK